MGAPCFWSSAGRFARHVIPRVSAALAQFIAPIATSGKQGLTAQQGFKRFGGDHSKQPSDPPKQQPPPPTEEPAKILAFAPRPKDPETAGAGIPNGISQALLQLMNLLQGQRATLLRWLGTGIYQTAARQQKKNGRIRKGTVLDEKAE